MGLPRWLSDKESACQCRRHRFDCWVRKIPLEKGMATYTSILAWEIPWTEKPGRLQSIGSHTVRHDSSVLARLLKNKSLAPGRALPGPAGRRTAIEGAAVTLSEA